MWSKLGRFKKITKEMTPENRIDLLTFVLLHEGQKIKDKLGNRVINVAYYYITSSQIALF